MNRIARTLLACLAASAAAGTATAQPRPTAGFYEALGTEPFWGLELDGRIMTFSYDEQSRTATQPRVIGMGATRRYMTPQMVVVISPGNCSDGMSDRTYADNVRVTLTRGINGVTRFEGCGGGLVPPRTLDQTSWRIVAINGAAVPGGSDGDRYQLRFDNGRITGAAGCNRLSGRYSEAGGRLTAGPFISTRMACPGPGMAHERAVSAILEGRPRISHPGAPRRMRDGVIMELTSPAGTIRLRQNDS